ncbi:hypothetical protein KJ359_011813 [Pestalotiopsis sp. 9143b]|nr:hypothetical protein KJ359_011813 [Pestalotiopsis sp. 9143b]
MTTSTTEASSTSTTDVTSSSTSSSSTSSDVPSSTSSLAPIVTNFVLTSANSVNSAANDQTVKYRPSTDSGWILYLETTNTAWSTGTFYLEDGTNHLMIDGLYVVTQSNNAVYSVNKRVSTQSYITCSSPVRSGSALSCHADDGVRTQLAVRTTSTANINIYILSPSALSSTYGAIDLIAA